MNDRTQPTENELPQNLRLLVRESVALLGQVIEREAGRPLFLIVEDLRESMVGLRGKSQHETLAELRRRLSGLRGLSKGSRREVARAFTLMLILMNACENAYRAFRLEGAKIEKKRKISPDSVVYVLTAHPTEARSPENIKVFQRIQSLLTEILKRETPVEVWRDQLLHELELAWRANSTRERSPRVKDEADHIYQMALRPEILRSLLAASGEVVPVYLRTWVGGDKDGHPGVDEKAMQESLQLSRESLLRHALTNLADVEDTLHLLPGRILRKETVATRASLLSLKKIGPGDGAKLTRAKALFHKLCSAYEKKIHALHPSLLEGKRLFHVFPGLVVPLELRESSDVLMSEKSQGKSDPRAIARMLARLATFARGGNPLWYARGFIVSMTESVDHLARAEEMVRAAFGTATLPVIPLFETTDSLAQSVSIIRELVKHPRLKKCVAGPSQGLIEIMVGYSDSAKQGGVLASRLAIACAMHALEKECKKHGLQPVFFQGSGGSVERGGGSVADQLAWWPKSALRTYKVTVQGEMVERSLSSASIARGQIERIANSAGEGLELTPHAPASAALFRLAELSSMAYREMVHDPDFLRLVGDATPYDHLAVLKIGSRPTRRSTEISVAGLRAIPWVLCWTQVRVMFQTWSGVGTAWRNLSQDEKKALQRDFTEEPVFRSFVKALAFTLAKIELPIWRMYLESSGLPKELYEKFYQAFTQELALVEELVRFVTANEEQKDWFKPWLGASIRLRSTMIHPLNLLQVIALREKDPVLFRSTTTGISSGMMVTG